MRSLTCGGISYASRKYLIHFRDMIEQSRAAENPKNEYKELIELLDCIDKEIAHTRPKKIYLIDVHSTSADSPLFSIVNDDKSTWAVAEAMKVPVVTGLVGKLSGGSTLEYFTNKNFHTPICSISIEAGQHSDPAAVVRAFNYLVIMLEYIGVIETSALKISTDNIHVDGLPTIVKYAYRHAITPDDHFEMHLGYKSFQKVEKGEVLAQDKNGAVISPKDGFILMPLYQKQGGDGFFLVEDVLW